MNDSLRSSAKIAREFLEALAEGIGRVESGAGELSRIGSTAASRLSSAGSAASDLTRSGAAAIARHLPARFRGSRSSTQVIAALVIAGVVASTAALIYSRTRHRDSRGRRRR
jgi:TRAP-type C4-dicarboxylate transport system permease large subunit